ncbi:MAG: PhaM family polyhydroxyalkanoate granule multifunctional regulatory protein, partial [Polaromonas sp.]
MSDADNPSFAGFGKLVPGFDFLQNLAKQAAGSATQSIPQLPNLGNWVAPTLNVEELDKRIDELKAVQFWLDQNATALKATIQALEVQKMTLATLKGMNFNMGDVANAFKLKVADSVAGGVQRVAEKARTFSGLEIP